LLVALAADHVISDPVALAQVCRLAADAAAADRIVTFGVRPTRPATEYGYICAGTAIGADIFAVEKFVEKPDGRTAERYMKEGYLWNSGNFMFRAGLLLDEYQKFEAESLAALTRCCFLPAIPATAAIASRTGYLWSRWCRAPGSERILAFLGPGAIVGEMSIIDGGHVPPQ
jgi:mannose-1-phosphate guanylyltransferase